MVCCLSQHSHAMCLLPTSPQNSGSSAHRQCVKHSANVPGSWSREAVGCLPLYDCSDVLIEEMDLDWLRSVILTSFTFELRRVLLQWIRDEHRRAFGRHPRFILRPHLALATDIATSELWTTTNTFIRVPWTFRLRQQGGLSSDAKWCIGCYLC